MLYLMLYYLMFMNRCVWRLFGPPLPSMQNQRRRSRSTAQGEGQRTAPRPSAVVARMKATPLLPTYPLSPLPLTTLVPTLRATLLRTITSSPSLPPVCILLTTPQLILSVSFHLFPPFPPTLFPQLTVFQVVYLMCTTILHHRRHSFLLLFLHRLWPLQPLPLAISSMTYQNVSLSLRCLVTRLFDLHRYAHTTIPTPPYYISLPPHPQSQSQPVYPSPTPPLPST